jgi:endo-alpha-1,4-polygalactosaminidase (GH114 family)
MFPNEAKAKRHLERLGSVLPGYTVAAHTWWPILKKNPETPEEAQKVQVDTVKRVQQYIKTCEEQNDKIMEQVGDEHAEDRYKESLSIWEKKNKMETELQLENEKSKGEEGDDDEFEIPRSAEVRGQMWCAVSIVSDPTLDDEPCINVLRAFEERGDADDYVRNTCLEEDVQTKVFACRMYEFIHPCLIHTKKFFDTVKTSYTYSDLEDIHRGKAEERQKIERILAAKNKTPEDIFKEVGERLDGKPAALEDTSASADTTDETVAADTETTTQT